MCQCFYKSLPILHGLWAIYEVICGIIRLTIFFNSTKNTSYTYDNNIFNNRTIQTITVSPPELRDVPKILAGFIIDWISSLIPTMTGIFVVFMLLCLSCRILRCCRGGHHQLRANCRLRDLITNKPIQRFLLVNCNCPCYIARPKWRFLVRFLFISISIGLRILAIILYATAPRYNSDEIFRRTQSLSWFCAMTLPSPLLALLLDYYHYRVWWHYLPSCDQNPFYRPYLKKHRRFIPYHLMGEHRNQIQLWSEPCELGQLCLDRKLEHIMIFHFNTHTPTPRWSDIPNKDPRTTTYIGFHRTDAVAAVSIGYTDFRVSTTIPQMLGFGIYFGRSIHHTQFKARRDGAVICAEILMGNVLEIENNELENVSNTDAWHQTFDTIYYRHPREPLRDEFCIKTNAQILKWVMYIEQPFDIKVEQYGLSTEFADTQWHCI